MSYKLVKWFSTAGVSFFFLAALLAFLLTACMRSEGTSNVSKPLSKVTDFTDLTDLELKSLADRLYERGENLEGVPVYEECLRRKIFQDEMSFRKGVSLHSLGQKTEAVNSLLVALEHNQGHLKAHFNLGAILL